MNRNITLIYNGEKIVDLQKPEDFTPDNLDGATFAMLASAESIVAGVCYAGGIADPEKLAELLDDFWGYVRERNDAEHCRRFAKDWLLALRKMLGKEA